MLFLVYKTQIRDMVYDLYICTYSEFERKFLSKKKGVVERSNGILKWRNDDDVYYFYTCKKVGMSYMGFV